MTLQMILDKMDQLIRLGYVNARMPEKMRVKVTLPDTVGGPLITDWLPVLCPRASGDMQYDLPDVGDQVLCLFLPNGLEQGFVIGSMYGKQVPPVQDADKWHRAFRDGTTLEYDRAAHQLTANIKGDASLAATGSVTMKAQGSITLEAPIIYVRGTLVNTASDGSPGKSVFSGGMEVSNGGINVLSGDVIAAGVSLVSHTTDGVEPGSGTSSHPTGGSPESPGTAARPLPEPGTAAYAAAVAAGMAEAEEKIREMPYSRRKVLADLIHCLPEIASSMAAGYERAGKDADAQGWRYLAGFFRRWISTKVVLPESGEYKEDAYEPPHLFISWEWLDKYPRIREKIEELKQSLNTPKFKTQFAEKLQKLGCLTSKTEYFDFIPADLSDTGQWKVWEESYKQYVKVEGGIRQFIYYNGDGLVSSMGDFTLRALPRGYVEPDKEKGGHKITITHLAVYAQDGFNFESDAPLQFWNCREKSFSATDPSAGTLLWNHDFRNFRQDTGHGGNFHIFSVPRMIDDFKGFSYDTTL